MADDDALLLITSANLTEAALERNVGAGLWYVTPYSRAAPYRSWPG